MRFFIYMCLDVLTSDRETLSLIYTDSLLVNEFGDLSQMACDCKYFVMLSLCQKLVNIQFVIK